MKKLKQMSILVLVGMGVSLAGAAEMSKVTEGLLSQTSDSGYESDRKTNSKGGVLSLGLSLGVEENQDVFGFSLQYLGERKPWRDTAIRLELDYNNGKNEDDRNWSSQQRVAFSFLPSLREASIYGDVAEFDFPGIFLEKYRNGAILSGFEIVKGKYRRFIPVSDSTEVLLQVGGALTYSEISELLDTEIAKEFRQKNVKLQLDPGFTYRIGGAAGIRLMEQILASVAYERNEVSKSGFSLEQDRTEFSVSYRLAPSAAKEFNYGEVALNYGDTKTSANLNQNGIAAEDKERSDEWTLSFKYDFN